MIEAIAAVFQIAMFAIWKMDNLFNVAIRICFLFLAVALGLDALHDFGFIVQVPGN
jgi:hypothetical protein